MLVVFVFGVSSFFRQNTVSTRYFLLITAGGKHRQGCHGQWKVREKRNFKVREKSVNFAFGQENLEFCSKSGKSQGNLYHFGYYEHQVTRTTKGNWERGKHIGRVNKKLRNIWSMLSFLYTLPGLRSVKLLLYFREKSGNFFHSDVWQPWQHPPYLNRSAGRFSSCCCPRTGWACSLWSICRGWKYRYLPLE